MKLVGLSVSLCVKDIMSGKVKMEDVRFIYAGTKCPDMEKWEGVIRSYRQIYWSRDPDKGESILRCLLATGRIIQPRLEGKHLVFENREMWNWIPSEEFNAYAARNLKPEY